MTLYDSSLLIDYLDGVDAAVEYITTRTNERAVTVPLVRFEVYQGEVYKSRPADFDALDAALDWLVVHEETTAMARTAAELQNRLHGNGDPLSARDAFVAGAAYHLDEPLAVADEDFDTTALHSVVSVDIVGG